MNKTVKSKRIERTSI